MTQSIIQIILGTNGRRIPEFGGAGNAWSYGLLADYEQHPENFPDGPTDEFHGRYSSTFIRNLRNNYRRNRDLCIILTGAMYVLQIVDAHVDAHLKDYDVSDDLSMHIEPMLNYTYVPTAGNLRPIVGFNMSLNF